MSRNKPLYLQVYASISNRIFNGEYAYRQMLPSIAALAAEYGVSIITIRGAFDLLKAEGLIEIGQGKEAIVAFHNTASLTNSEYARWMLEHKGAIIDLYWLHENYIPQAIAFAVLHADADIVDSLAMILAQTPQQCDTICKILDGLREFMMRILACADNDILLGLYRQIEEFIRVPLLLTNQENMMQSHMRTKSHVFMEIMLELVREKDIIGIYYYVKGEYAGMASMFSRMAYDIAGAARAEHKAVFRWSLRPENDFRYTEIANEIIIKIACGDYPIGTLLPSAGALCQGYDAAPITIRRALQRLNRLGLTRTINGIGTEITGIRVNRNTLERLQGEANSSENTRMYAETLQALALALPVIVRPALSNLSDSEITALVQKLTTPAAGVCCRNMIVLLNTLLCDSPCKAAHDILIQFEIVLCLASYYEAVFIRDYADELDTIRTCGVEVTDCVRSRDAIGIQKRLFAQLNALFNITVKNAADRGMGRPFFVDAEFADLMLV